MNINLGDLYLAIVVVVTVLVVVWQTRKATAQRVQPRSVSTSSYRERFDH